MSQILPMQFLTPGETGCVREVEGEKHLIRRLDEMGLRAGVEVRMVQPGRPCIVALDHQRLSFRGEEEAVVLVEVDRN
ncbi:MAG TPA: FeoA family protein [Planctomycetaceae bacterium]